MPHLEIRRINANEGLAPVTIEQALSIVSKLPENYSFIKWSIVVEKGESYLDPIVCRVIRSPTSFTSYTHLAIVEEKAVAWQWPEWLTAPYIAMDCDGAWYSYMSEPVKSLSASVWAGNFMSRLSGGHLAITFPECDDWTKSLRKNPNAKSTV